MSSSTARPGVPGSFLARCKSLDAKEWAPLITLLALVIFFSIITQFRSLAQGAPFLSLGTAINILQQGSILMIVAAGLTFVMVCGEIDLSVGMLALWTASCFGWMLKHFFPAGDPAAVPSTLQLAGLVMLAVGTSVALGITSGVLKVWARLPSFIVTLAMMFIAEGAAQYLTHSEAQSMPDLLKFIGSRNIPFKPLSFLPISPVLAAAVALVGFLTLRYTRFGRYVYMTGGNREAARLAGVRTERIVVACLAISALTAGMAGILNAGRLGSVTMDQNKDMVLNAVACVVLGGTSLFGGEGGIGRTVVGVLTFAVLTVGLDKIAAIPSDARKLTMGVVFLVALVINGLISRRG